LDAPASLLPAAKKSRKLRIIALALIVLPLLLLIPFEFLQIRLIEPIVETQRQLYCAVDCSSVTYWERVATLLALGPSMLVALVAVIFGIVGLVRAQRHPISLKDDQWLQASIIFGILWLIILGCLFGGLFEIEGLIP
jgi:hypothetical protein